MDDREPSMFSTGWGRVRRRYRSARFYNLNAAAWYRYKRWVLRHPDVAERQAAISRDMAVAFPDPIAGLSALARPGVMFGDSFVTDRWAKWRIKFWLRLGRKNRAQRIILKQLPKALG